MTWGRDRRGVEWMVDERDQNLMTHERLFIILNDHKSTQKRGADDAF